MMATTSRLVLRAPLLVLFLFTLSLAEIPAHAEGAAVSNGSIPDQLQPDDEKNLDQLQESVSLFPYNEPLRKKLAEAYVNIGQRQLKQKKFDEAAESFGRASELIPARQDFGIRRGIALYLGKHYDEAAYELESDRSTGGDTPPLLLYLGLVQYDTG